MRSSSEVNSLRDSSSEGAFTRARMDAMAGAEAIMKPPVVKTRERVVRARSCRKRDWRAVADGLGPS